MNILSAGNFSDSIAKVLSTSEGFIDNVAKRIEERQKAEALRNIWIDDCGSSLSEEYFRSHNIEIKEAIPNTSIDIEFQWFARENDAIDIPKARTHLIKQLKKFGAKLQVKYFELYDCHAEQNCLSVSDETFGILRGGTDLVIAPQGLSIESSIQRACAIFSFKKTVKNKHFGQMILALFAASNKSSFPVVAVLTDLNTEVHVFQFTNYNTIYRYKMSLSQMGDFICKHMQSGKYHDINYKLVRSVEESKSKKKRPHEETHAEFQKRFRTNDDTLFEQFHELLEMTEKGSKERREVVENYFTSFYKNEN